MVTARGLDGGAAAPEIRATSVHECESLCQPGQLHNLIDFDIYTTKNDSDFLLFRSTGQLGQGAEAALIDPFYKEKVQQRFPIGIAEILADILQAFCHPFSV